MNASRTLVNDLEELARLHPDADATGRAIDRARGAVLANVELSARKKSILRLRSLLGGVAALAAIGFIAYLLNLATATRTFAFSDVQHEVGRTKTVQYIETRKDRDGKKRSAPEETRKVMILGTYRMREEMKITTPGDRLPAGAAWATFPHEHVQIHDAKTGKSIVLFPSQKGYTVPHATLSIDDTGKIKESKIAATPAVDFYQSIRDVPTGKAKKIAEKEIGGKLATGFQVVEKFERPGGTNTWTKTYWIDPKTKLPVRIETSFQSTHAMMSDSEWVQSDFVFDAALDEALFRTDPPSGYTELDGATEKSNESEQPNKTGGTDNAIP